MFRIHLSSLAASVALMTSVFPCASAQAQSSKVVPPSATTTEGDSFNYMPFIYDISRTQQVWLGKAVANSAAVLSGINFRRDGSLTSSFSAVTLTSHVVSLGHTSVSPSTMSTTFSNNVTSTMTIIQSGQYSLPALPVPNPAPAPFAIKYPLSTPFIYTVAKGNLLMEWVTGSGQATTRRVYYLDAVTATTGGSGAVRPFGAWGKFAGNDSPTWKADPQKLVPGGSADISLGGFSQAYASKLFFGLSDKSWNGLTLPYDLAAIGAPGNNLYTGLDVVAPFTLTQVSTTSYGANPIFPLPNDSKLIGFKAFVQSYYGDAKANAAGLVASDAMELTIGSVGPISKVMGTSSTTATTGTFWNQPPVVQFVGGLN